MTTPHFPTSDCTALCPQNLPAQATASCDSERSDLPCREHAYWLTCFALAGARGSSSPAVLLHLQRTLVHPVGADRTRGSAERSSSPSAKSCGPIPDTSGDALSCRIQRASSQAGSGRQALKTAAEVRRDRRRRHHRRVRRSPAAAPGGCDGDTTAVTSRSRRAPVTGGWPARHNGTARSPGPLLTAGH